MFWRFVLPEGDIQPLTTRVVPLANAADEALRALWKIWTLTCTMHSAVRIESENIIAARLLATIKKFTFVL
jgi:hypothetical protein